MKERPILFSAPMVRAILNGTKTQTRRVFKLPKGHRWDQQAGGEAKGNIERDEWYQGPWHVSEFRCPYGQPGNRLWVRESFCPIYPQDPTYNGGRPIEYDYAATYQHGNRLGDIMGIKKRWTPSIHMPRWASRITLEVTGVRVERLQDISEADAIAEGIERAPSMGKPGAFQWCDYRLPNEPSEWFNDPVRSYQTLWESINGPGSWDANPWVWVVEFKRVEGVTP